MRETLLIFRAAWAIYCWFCGIGVIAGLASWGIVALLVVSEPVSVHTDQQFLTPLVPIGGILEYVVDVDRRRPCPGDVVETFRSLSGPQAHITFRRPAAILDVRKYPALRFRLALPSSVTAGAWRLIQTLESRCPSSKQVDTIITADFEVYVP